VRHLTSAGRPVVTGGPNLKETQTYPLAFGRRLAETVTRTYADYYEEQMENMDVEDHEQESTTEDVLAIVDVFTAIEKENQLWDDARRPHTTCRFVAMCVCVSTHLEVWSQVAPLRLDEAQLLSVVKYIIGSSRIIVPFGLCLEELLRSIGVQVEATNQQCA
jgi:hypothetical protein